MLYPSLKASAEANRVVITGVGVLTGLGAGWEANAAGFRLGRPAFAPVTLFDVSRQRARIAAQAALPDPLPHTRLAPRRLQRMDRAARLLLCATLEAWRQSGWETSDRLPFVLGTTSAGMSKGESYYRQSLSTPGRPRNQAARVLGYQAQRQVLDTADAVGFSGPTILISNACASGANALGHAWSLLRSGRAHQALAGGYEGLCQLVFAGFDSLQALSPTPCRPFDANRDGLSIGEGAAVFALETLEHASRRNAAILGEIAGYAAATDIHHLTQPHPDGDAALTTMTAACRAAGVSPEAIDYVNAHGTGTVLNDSSEAAAINRWAGSRAPALNVSSTKSSVGHLLGAAGAVEAAVCLMALRGQWLPPTLTTVSPDPLCQFPILRQPTEARVEVALSNSFGFGGANATLILRRWP